MDLNNFNYISTRRNHVFAPLPSLIPCLLVPPPLPSPSPLSSPFSSSSTVPYSVYSLSYSSSSAWYPRVAAAASRPSSPPACGSWSSPSPLVVADHPSKLVLSLFSHHLWQDTLNTLLPSSLQKLALPLTISTFGGWSSL